MIIETSSVGDRKPSLLESGIAGEIVFTLATSISESLFGFHRCSTWKVRKEDAEEAITTRIHEGYGPEEPRGKYMLGVKATPRFDAHVVPSSCNDRDAVEERQ